MQNKSLLFITVSILALVVAVCIIFPRLSLIEQRIGAIEKTNDAASKDIAAAGAKTVPAQRKTKSVEIIISDEGFSPSGFQMGTKEIVTISITNHGKSAHSFVIDDPATDSGPIEVGQTKTVTINKRFDQPVALKYYSNIGSDSADSFKGTIMVF